MEHFIPQSKSVDRRRPRGISRTPDMKGNVHKQIRPSFVGGFNKKRAELKAVSSFFIERTEELNN